MEVKAKHVKDFKPGDRVRHVSRDELGTVERVDDYVHVRFDKPTPRGAASRGEYDELWFSKFPRGLQLVECDAAA
jgi:hypothetical protein